ncbi:unnamed protein product, partial [Lampetra planeri]
MLPNPAIGRTCACWAFQGELDATYPRRSRNASPRSRERLTSRRQCQEIKPKRRPPGRKSSALTVTPRQILADYGQQM